MSWHLEILSGPDQGKKIALPGGSSISIGRDPSQCNLVLSDEQVSRLHARVTCRTDGMLQVEDSGSTYGTFVNQARISGAEKIKPEDSITLGSSTIGLVWAPGAVSPSDEGKETVAAYIRIGRAATNDLVINHSQVSRNHALLERRPGSTCLVDLESTYGTYLNGRQIKGAAKLDPSSWIQICGVNLFFDGLNLQSEQGAIVATLGAATADAEQPLAQTLLVPFNKIGFLKLLIGSLLAAIPLVNFFTEGYRYQAFKGGADGRMEMPEWKDWNDLFVKGLLYSLVWLIYFLPPLFVVFIIIAAAMAPAGPGAGVLPVFLIFVLLFMFLASAFFLPMGWARFAATGRFGSIFELGTIVALIKNVAARYTIVLLLLAAMWIVLGLILLIPMLGILITVLGAFYIKVVFALLFGELYRLSSSMHALEQ